MFFRPGFSCFETKLNKKAGVVTSNKACVVINNKACDAISNKACVVY